MISGGAPVADGEGRQEELEQVRAEIVERRDIGHRRDHAEPSHEQEDHDHGEPERRHAEPGQGEEAQDVVDRPVLANRADHAGRHAEQDREAERQHRQLERHGQARLDDLPGGQVVAVGLAEIAAQEIAQPDGVLDGDGLVEPQLDLQALLVRLVDVPRRLEDDVGDIAGRQAHEEEDEHRHAQQGEPGDHEPLDDVGAHGKAPSLGRPVATCRARRPDGETRCRSSSRARSSP